MTGQQIAAMDARDLDEYPHFRKFLKVRNMAASRLVYHLRKRLPSVYLTTSRSAGGTKGLVAVALR